MKKSKAIFNPEAAYQAPPGGLVVKNLVMTEEDGSKKLTGPIRVPSGTMIVYDPELVNE